MRKYLFAFIAVLLFGRGTQAQQPLSAARQQSWTALVYRIPADTAGFYLASGDLRNIQLAHLTPFTIWHADSARDSELPYGHYAIVKAVGPNVAVRIHSATGLYHFISNISGHWKFDILDSMGYRQDAIIRSKGRDFGYDPVAGYMVPATKKASNLVRISVPGDTLFVRLESDDAVPSVWQQWWSYLPATRAGHYITWPVRKIKFLMNTPRYAWRQRRAKPAGFKSYLVFNKPRYQPGDTVKFKVTLMTRKYRPYRKPVIVYLSYMKSGSAIRQSLGSFRPKSHGSLVHELVLTDSLPTDTRYTVSFFSTKEKLIASGEFNTEDYLLNEGTTFNLRSNKSDYHRRDTMQFYASGKDANGLPLMESRVKLLLLPKDVTAINRETLHVRDTLYSGETLLSSQGETVIKIPTDILPDASLEMEAIAIFTNSNNEIDERSHRVKYIGDREMIYVKEENGFITAEFLEDGKSIGKEGLMDTDFREDMPIRFPYRLRADQFNSVYWFFAVAENGKSLVESFTPRYSGMAHFRSQQVKDSAGFIIDNPSGFRIHYSVRKGNKVIATGSDTSGSVSWIDRLQHGMQYRVDWGYLFDDQERRFTNYVQLLDRLLQTTIDHRSVVYPGQTDTIRLEVKDYRGRAAKNVDLTAVSYSGKFGNIKVPEPATYWRFRRKFSRRYPVFTSEEADLSQVMLAGKLNQWREKLGLDTMRYYQLLFPGNKAGVQATAITTYKPQVAVHVVKNGVPQQVFMLFVNREFRYSSRVTLRAPYTFDTWAGYTQVGVRLQDRYIEIDSIYLQPFYKFDISLELDSLPVNAKVTEKPPYYTLPEQQLLNSHLFVLQNNDYSDKAELSQGPLVYYPSRKYGMEIGGPFIPGDSIHVSKEGYPELAIPFERGYAYRFAKNIARLEQHVLYPPASRNKPVMATMLPVLRLGDTLLPRKSFSAKPASTYNVQLFPPVSISRASKLGDGRVHIINPGDSVMRWILVNTDSSDKYFVAPQGTHKFDNLDPGNYELVMMQASDKYAKISSLKVIANTTLYIRIDSANYLPADMHVAEIVKRLLEEPPAPAKPVAQLVSPAMTGLPLPGGTATLNGVVKDIAGKYPIAGAVVTILGYQGGAFTDQSGKFLFKEIGAGNYRLQISSVGYLSKTMTVALEQGQVKILDIGLVAGSGSLEEVVVTGYAISRKMELTGSVASLRSEGVTEALNGRIAGVHIRGLNSAPGASPPLYVINGVLTNELPASFTDMASVQVLKGDVAIALYGARAANGVIVINTDAPSVMRTKFSDYAIWEPKLLTDKNGRASFVVTYPDDVTSWNTSVIGIDNRKRITKSVTVTRSIRQLLAQVSLPRFLVEGDSAVAIGRITNYTASGVDVSVGTEVNGSPLPTATLTVDGGTAAIREIGLLATGNDSLNISFSANVDGKLADGESRSIPVLRRGVEESRGIFSVLLADTSFVFSPLPGGGEVMIHAQSNSLQMLLDELKQLHEYPWACMEQTASKLVGLEAERIIRAKLNQPFEQNTKRLQLISQLQKGQLYDGSWGWWSGGKSNFYITNYVARALLDVRREPMVQMNIRNAILYLQNQLPGLHGPALTEALYTLSQAGHVMDYGNPINSLRTDTLDIHHQWQLVTVMKTQGLPYTELMNELIAKRKVTMTGSVCWGEPSTSWWRNDMATTVLAFKLLSQLPDHAHLLDGMLQYFLDRKAGGKWANTVESAQITATILPYLASRQNKVDDQATLLIKGEVQQAITKFPHTMKVPPGNALHFTKTGGAFIYLGVSQRVHIENPELVAKDFIVETRLEQNRQIVSSLHAGQKATMRVSVEAKKDASYVMLTVPIPAGCTYNEKDQGNGFDNIHKQFFKDKVVLFIENMPAGKHSFPVNLEARYTGRYHINPAVAELMYFPVFFGRTASSSIFVNK